MKKITALIALSITLAGCATGYHPVSRTGGYDELMLSDDTYVVIFKGNAYTSQDKVIKYALRRCADLTKEKGYSYFDILKSSSSTSQYAYKTPVQAHTDSSYNGYANGNYGYVNGSSATTYTGGDTINIHAYARSITIKMYKTSMPSAFDADAILNSTS